MSATSKVTPPAPFDLDTPLVTFSPLDGFTIRHAVEGVAIFGAVGSGKTSGSGATLARAYLAAGMGGLVCCVKPDERALWERYAAQTGRSDSLIVISPSNRWRCNLMHYLLKRPGVEGSRTEQLVNLFMTVLETADRGDRDRGGNAKFWERAVRQLLRNAIDICVLATGTASVAALNRIINSAPRSHAEVHDATYFGYAVVSTLPLLSGFSSIAILCSLAFLAASLFHRYEINDRNRRGVTWHSFSKGESWLYELDLSDIPFRLNDEVIHKWIEPALVGIAGGIAYLFAPAVGIWLLISAVALTVNAQIDYHYERSVFLDARDGQVEARYLGDALSGRPASQTAGLVIAASNVAMVQRDPGLKAAFGSLGNELLSMMDAGTAPVR